MYWLMYDQEFQDGYDTLAECVAAINWRVMEYEVDKTKYPEYYSEEDTYPFDMWEIMKVEYSGDTIEKLVKNST